MFPSIELTTQIYLKLFDNYRVRCLNENRPLDKDYLLQLAKESIAQASAFEKTYYDELKKFNGI